MLFQGKWPNELSTCNKEKKISRNKKPVNRENHLFSFSAFLSNSKKMPSSKIIDYEKIIILWHKMLHVGLRMMKKTMKIIKKINGRKILAIIVLYGET